MVLFVYLLGLIVLTSIKAFIFFYKEGNFDKTEMKRINFETDELYYISNEKRISVANRLVYKYILHPNSSTNY